MALLRYRLSGNPSLGCSTNQRWADFFGILFCSLLVFLAPTEAQAGDFTVTPVRLHFGVRDRAIAVTLTNDGDSPLMMQADLFEWQQEASGKDVLTPTEDLFLSPPIVTIPPNSRQVVRLARLSEGPPSSDEPSTYRMIVREIPEATVEKTVMVKIALAFSLPIFFAPAEPKRQLDCQAKRLSPDSIRATCENKGNVYALVTHLALSTQGSNVLLGQDIGGGYILPGVTRSFDLKRQGGKIPAGQAQLEAQLDDLSRERYDISLVD